jgi:hypothetical protein
MDKKIDDCLEICSKSNGCVGGKKEETHTTSAKILRQVVSLN